MTLTEFLLARIAEDEERAEFVRRENEGPWHRPFEVWKLSWHDEYDLLCIEPERALVECEARRSIVAEVQTWLSLKPKGVEAPATEEMMTRPLRHLAAVYANHPDYRDEWRP